jgi:hypothetical protein
MTDDDYKQDVGFRVMDPATQRKIAAKGGRTAHRLGKAHRFTSEQARAAALCARAKETADPQRLIARLQKAAATVERRAKAWITD